MKKLTKFISVVMSLAILLPFLLIAPLKSQAADKPCITMLIEGLKNEIYNGEVSFTKGENFYSVMSEELASKGIELSATESSYGHMINSIGGESGTYPIWWHLYVNGESSQVGADSLEPANGDKIVMYLGDDSKILYPTVKITPEHPLAGETATINVSSSYTDYSDYSTKTVEFANAKIKFNGKTYTTGSNGSASVQLPDTAGDYTFTVSKTASDSTQALVNIGNIPITVYADAGETTGKSNSGGAGSSSKSGVPADIATAINTGASYLATNGVDDWNASLSLADAGRSVPAGFLESAAEDIAQGGVLPTHLAGLITGIKAAGGNPQNFNGQNLISQLMSSDIGKTGLNGYTYALLALDCGKYGIPSSSSYTREQIISSILSFQKSSGAFSLEKNSSADTDMTAIAITSLAPYMNRTAVKKKVDSAVSYLSSAQRSDGGFLPSYSSNESSESVSQVVIALSSIGINPKSDARFVKNGKSAVDALMSFRTANGGFRHVKSGGADYTATEQAVLALCSYKSLLNSGSNVFDLTGIKSESSTVVKTSSSETAIENPDTGSPFNTAPAACAVIIAAFSLAAAAKFKRSGKI